MARAASARPPAGAGLPPMAIAPRSTASVPASASRSSERAGKRLQKLRLAVAGDAGDADDLAGVDGEAQVVDAEHAAAVERLQDLHPLLQADGQRADDGVRVDIEPVFAFEALKLVPGFVQAAAQEVARLDAEHHVLEHREGVHQHEMLVDHPDTAGDGVLGAPDRGRCAVDPDLAAIGLVVAVDDAHQCRFAGAVLADDAVNRAGGDGDRYVVVRVN